MKKRKTLVQLMDEWKTEPDMMERIVHWHTRKEKPAVYADFPEMMHESLKNALLKKGVGQLYTHQRQAFDLAQEHKSYTAVTPTASGKSYCYHLPVLNRILNDPGARALYLFPTKALAQDQKSDLHDLIEKTEADILSYTYDGDTSPAIRTKVRKAGQIVMTNPDMLHSAILPHHTKWVSLFENLHYIVIDELHTYKGVFGTHVAHVIRRLKRICEFYGSNPIFICTSATIANPKELAESLTNTEHVLIDQNGAPAGKKHIVFYNPPIIHPTFGVRRSAVLEVRDLATQLIKEGIQTIVFAKSRVRVEMLVTYLQAVTKHKLQDESIKGYRGGYLPTERRAIEKGLRDGS
ncbi:MAG TPA: DEAD/DEAH box helicase, partial [Planococcus sp. (in: firmicutes)]|nr:DEAD/DEAH box helicase [Planococcus sp. (in: firmicutes)]